MFVRLVDAHVAWTIWLVAGRHPVGSAQVRAVRPVTQVNHDTGYVQRFKVLRRGRKCDKFAYSSKKIAKAVAGQQSKNTGERIEAYHCMGCHCYHIGHPYVRDPKQARGRAS